ncbi:transcriptional regulator [Metallosphaera hakonensis]|uniref:Transcriptional regulator n=1 Tax=Metallosphaera hakonensis JCM 8857 = DSM 7519 TaxID=1293036 RepID=A0A2U9IVZ8_9CREN|nr:transcriptional regulator [Metallosphaera hakonensis]AWS00252.1 transcriptional regulator [Metallosphaera hakonensis JCM 8857 = DSM 7519]
MRNESRKLIIPCESAMRDIIPAIKALLVTQLVSNGISQSQAASILGLTPAEISYYLKGKRADGKYKSVLENDEEFMEMIRHYSVRLGETDTVNICPLCSLARKKLGMMDYTCPYDW